MSGPCELLDLGARRLLQGVLGSPVSANHWGPFPGSAVHKPVYHGTDARFDRFIPTPGKRGFGPFAQQWEVQAGGFFFTPSVKTAQTYGRNVIEAYLDIQDPLVVPRDTNLTDTQPIVEALTPFIDRKVSQRGWAGVLKLGDLEIPILEGEENSRFPEWPEKLLRGQEDRVTGVHWSLLDDHKFTGAMKKAGYDDTSVYEHNDEEGYSWFVFSPNQIKWRWLEL